ncbi:MAG: glycerol kinase [Rhodospirillaceae bacterium]|nr:MAG: glycerol kinase [Rhodospirillaceae bacterium]
MTGTTRILAIDQGTTSTRAVMFDAKAQPLATAQMPLPQIFPRDGWVEHDPELIWEAVVATCRQVIAATGGIDGVAAIGITNQRETTVLWDRKSGRPVMNAIVWQDRRGADMCRELRANGHEPLIQARTGLLADSYFSATKLAWMFKNVDGAHAAAMRGDLAFGTIDSFLLWRLTGGRVHATDATNASRTMLYDIHKNAWDADLLALFDIPASILPDVRDSAGVFGVTEASLFGRAIPVTALVGDQQGALVGQACFAPGMIKSTYGTGCFVLANTGPTAHTSHNRLLTTIAYRLNGATTYALEGSIFNAGTVIQWLRDGVGMIASAAESEAYAAGLDKDGGTGRIYFVPAFTGLGAPHWDPDARAAIIGLGRDSTRAHIVRAGLESVCYQTHDLLTALAADGMATPAALRVDGGMAANRWLLQFLADITNLPVERPIYGETTVLGAAFLAGLGIGIYSDLHAVEAAWRLDFQAIPTMAGGQRTARIAGWRDAVARIRTSLDGR